MNICNFRAASFIGASLLLSVAVQAANFSQGTSHVTDVTSVSNSNSFNATASANFTGNNNNYGGTGFQNFINSTFSSQLVGYSGTWSYGGDLTTTSTTWTSAATLNSPYVVTVKAADFFAAYLFTGLTNVTNGTYIVDGVTTGNQPGQHAGLSHMSIYSFSGVSPTPEPETYAMMIAGLGLVRAATRRRKAATAS